MRPGETGAAYVTRVLADTSRFRRFHHPGNIAYGWRFDGAALPRQPYPKHDQLVRAA